LSTETQPESAPASGTRVELAGRTDVGLIREHNEDSFMVVRLDDNVRDGAALRKHTLLPKGTLMVVCDGMGGAAAGEVASNMAVESIAATMLTDVVVPPPEGWTDDDKQSLARKLRMAAKEANTQIFREARANLTRSGMGTTMTAVLLREKWAVIAQVGDSRAYVWRDGKFTQVTRDQSLVNQLLETGHITAEQAKYFEHSNVILQALGVQEDVEVQLSQVELRRGDRFVVCSDGLVGVVTDEEIGAVMGACEDPDEAARILIELANGAGGPDNISVVVAHVAGDPPPPTADDALEYQLWKIDPEPPPSEYPSEPEQVPGDAQGDAGELAARPPPTNPLVELVSMAVVFGLILGSVLTGAVLYRSGVSCLVDAKSPGLAVMADGRDTGVRTAPSGEPSVSVRLKPGKHTLSLRGNGAPTDIKEVEVARGGLCEVTFAGRETASDALPEPSAEPSEGQ
jgi:PPM family protein phosphatase